MSRRGIDGTCVGLEEATRGQRLVELADVDATDFWPSTYVVEESPTIREELRREVAPLLGQSCQADGFAAAVGDTRNRPSQCGKEDDSVSVPGTAGTRRGSCKRSHRPAVHVDSLELCLRKKTDGLTVRRPERGFCGVGPIHDTRRTSLKRPKPQARLPIRGSYEGDGESVRRDCLREWRHGWRRRDIDAAFPAPQESGDGRTSTNRRGL